MGDNSSGGFKHTLVAGLLATSQYLEGPETGHLGTGFYWFPCAYKQMLRWFPRLQFATACFSCSPPDLNFIDSYFIFMYMRYNHCHRATASLQLNILLLLLLLLLFDIDVSCHKPFLPGTSLEPAVIPTAHASSFTLQYFPYYV